MNAHRMRVKGNAEGDQNTLSEKRFNDVY